MNAERVYILSPTEAEQKLNRMAYEVFENNFAEEELILAGIRPNGLVLAERMAARLSSITDKQIETVSVGVDKQNPTASPVELGCESEKLRNKAVILVDDVLNTGRTISYAAVPFLRAGVKQLRGLVLVNRDHTLYPFKADYVGINLATTIQEHVFVEIEETDEITAYLV